MNPTRKLFALTFIAFSQLLPMAAQAQFTLVETGGTFRSNAVNLARPANGGTAIGQDELNYGIHFISTINDGTYGNASSWIGYADFGATSWVGVALSGPQNIQSFAFGRDNTGVESTRADWAPYTIQYTTSANVASAPADATWITIGTLNYASNPPPSPALRHLYDLTSPISGVTGFRIVTDGGLSNGNAIDELEVYSTAAAIPEPSTYAALAGLGALGLVLWRRRRAAAA